MGMSVEGRLGLAVVSAGGDRAAEYLHSVVSGEPLARGGGAVSRIDWVWPADDVVM